MNTPTWRASCWFFICQPIEGIPQGSIFVGGGSPDLQLDGKSEDTGHWFIQV
jgi:hypothetical protein